MVGGGGGGGAFYKEEQLMHILFLPQKKYDATKKKNKTCHRDRIAQPIT